MSTSYLRLAVFTISWAAISAKKCEPGWFGSSCQFRCRCKNNVNCDYYGGCSDGCIEGWFGHACQFVNIASPVHRRESNFENNGSCFLVNRAIEFSFHEPKYFTWMRVDFGPREHNREFSVLLEQENLTLGCLRNYIGNVTEHTVDYYCDNLCMFWRIKISWSQPVILCKIYISGGRNVALKQKLVSVATLETFDSVVDSDDNTCLKNVGALTISFSQPHTLYGLHIRTHSYPVQLQSYLKQIETLFVVVILNGRWIVMNELNYTALKHISNFEFVDTSVQVFTACEFLIYGDVVCKPGQFGLECEHTCRCAKRSDFCFLQTGYCVFGCPAGFKGVGCLTPCIPPYYGHDCSRICSSNCENLICDSVDGKCKRCVPGRFGDYCETAQLECSSNCAYKKCRSDNFTCISCIKGRHGEYCEKECTNNTFGENCSQKCSKSCHLGAVKSSQVCDPVSGECVAAAIQTADILQRQGIVETLLTVLLICLAIPMCLTFGGVIYRKSKKIAHSRPSIIAENKGRGENLTAIPIDSFNTYMKEHTVEFLEKQFKSIPENETASKQIGLGKENVTKNVRRSITAFDHSRVYLIPNQEKNHGDYINACFVNVQGNEEIIASQGPNTWTIVDFLRMLRERNVGKVVMLNNVNEKDVVQYWSDNEITFECMKVKVLDTQVYTDYTIREMELTKEDLPPWSLTQYHYTSWPQEGYPPCIWSFVNFENRVFLESIKYHTVVHCRTGAGRTAMFIALHELVKQAKATKKVDLVTTVRKLREDRPRMIEKLDQFIYLHEATQVALACVDTFIKLEDVFLKVFQLDHPKPGQETFESEFNKISYVTSVLQGEYGEENNAEKNKSKNRCHDILPKERYRPLLQIDEEDEDDYINAIFVPDFNKLSQQILTQLPLPTTVTDFWRLVIQHNVTLIVAFESDLKDKDATIGDYIPEDYDSPLQCGNINVSLQNLITQTDWEEKSLVVSNKSTNHQVTHLKYTANINDVVVRIFLPFILHARSKRTEEGAVIYTCRDGAKYSGLACVLTVLVDRLERDHMMTVPLAVGRVKSIRQQVISTVQQYMTVYQGIKTFSDSMNRTAAS